MVHSYHEAMEKIHNSKEKTKILLIAAKQQAEFIKFYQTPSSRFYLLPPGINKKFIAPDNANEIRSGRRQGRS